MRFFGLLGKFLNSVFISAIMSMIVWLYNLAPFSSFSCSILFYFLANDHRFEKYWTKNFINFCRFFAEASIGICSFCFVFGYLTSQKKLPELSVILAILVVSFFAKHLIHQKMEKQLK